MMPDQRKLIGCSFSTAFVGLWVVDLQQASGGRSEGVRVCVGVSRGCARARVMRCELQSLMIGPPADFKVNACTNEGPGYFSAAGGIFFLLVRIGITCCRHSQSNVADYVQWRPGLPCLIVCYLAFGLRGLDLIMIMMQSHRVHTCVHPLSPAGAGHAVACSTYRIRHGSTTHRGGPWPSIRHYTSTATTTATTCPTPRTPRYPHCS
jgi:hypothetical protein